MLRVTLYTKSECGLCDEAHEMLKGLSDAYPHQLAIVDIEKDEALWRRYASSVPVIAVGPFTLKAPFTERELRVTLAAAQDSPHAERHPLTGQRRQQAIRLNKALLSFTRHWLLVFNLIVFLYAGLPFAAPVLMEVGAVTPAKWIYSLYSPFCHQLGFRSWFLFGDQLAYPRQMAGLPLGTFEDMTGIPEDNLWTARDFIGDARLGYKVALCERDVAIYGFILLAGLVYGAFHRRIKVHPLPLALWVLFGVLPIALDGGTQLISQWPGFPLPARESTPLLRTLTGALFGVMNVWLAYPYVEESMTDTRAAVAAKLTVADQTAFTPSVGD